MITAVQKPWTFIVLLMIFFSGTIFFSFTRIFTDLVLADSTINSTIHTQGESRVPNEILIQFKGEQTVNRFRFPEGASVDNAITLLQNNPRVVHVEPHYRVKSAAVDIVPTDPLSEKQSYLAMTHIPQAWALTTGSAQVTVAVLDSGVDIYHPDLRENIWTNGGEIPSDGLDNDQNGYRDDVYGWDFVDDTPDPTPKFSGEFVQAGIHHGTIMAGIIAAQGNNGIGIAGVSWRSKIMSLRVLDNNGDGEVIAVVNAIDYLIKKKADIVNLSFVGSGESQFLKNALKRAYDAGIIIVSASGNDQTVHNGFDLAQAPVYPACFDYGKEDFVIGVASVDPLGQKAQFSNYGPCIDIAAPGIDFYVTQVVRYDQQGFDTFYGSGWSGTSLSTAVVSGALALAKSVNPSLTPSAAHALLVSSCSPLDTLAGVYSGKLGCGLLNVEALVRQAIEQGREEQTPNEDIGIKPNTIVITTADGKNPILFFEGITQKPNRQLFPFDPKRIPFSMSGSDQRSGIFAVASGPGNASYVRVYDRELRNLSQFLAYDVGFTKGVLTAVADLDGDGEDEVVTAPGPGGGPHIKIFDILGSLKSHFFAYAPSYRGGLRIYAGDLNSDGRYEIITTPINPTKNTRTEVRIFSQKGVLLSQFFAYPRSSITHITLAVGDIDGDGFSEIVAAPQDKPGPVRIFSSAGILKKEFYPFPKEFNFPVTIALADVNADGKDDIIAAPGKLAAPHVRIFDSSLHLLAQFYAFDKNKRTVLHLGVIR